MEDITQTLKRLHIKNNQLQDMFIVLVDNLEKKGLIDAKELKEDIDEKIKSTYTIRVATKYREYNIASL